MNKKPIPLYITDSLDVLETLIGKDDAIKSFKKAHKFSNIVQKMMNELLQCQDDQEKCYILGRRYLNLIDHLFKISDDQNYTRSMFIGDYNRVKQLVADLKVSLAERYEAETKFESTSDITSITESIVTSITTTNTNSETDSGNEADTESTRSPRGSSNNGGTYIISNTARECFKEPLVFKEKFITPADLFAIFLRTHNVLMVDIRTSDDFRDSRIHIEGGTLINIPGDIVLPGLSANTLGLRLTPEVREIWETRDSFDLIILMDYDTLNYTFPGSKLERLRSFIVEWDYNRKYKQEPVILNGGLREFVEWYPSEVDNSQVFLSQTNSEIDELLDLESVTYPETGTGIQMNLKIHSINSVGNLESRIQRDFGKSEDLDELPELHSRSEGNLPVDFYSSKGPLPAGPYKSVSQDSIPKEYSPTDPLERSHLTELIIDEMGMEVDLKPGKIEEILADEKAALLRKAREAVKPKIDNDGKEAEFEKGDADEGQNELAVIKPPSINRSFKPLPVRKVEYGDGYTALKNVRNICYMNCMLHCLKVIPVIKATYVTSDQYLNHQTRRPPKINADVAEVLRELWGGTFFSHKFFYIEKFKSKIADIAPMYDKNTHEDTFEFFMFLFNLMSEDCAIDLPRPRIMTESEKAWYGHLQGRTSFLVDTFYYQLKNTKVCWNCRRHNLSFETDSTLMLPVYQSTCYLQLLIDDYMKENLVPDYSCSDCKSTATIVNMKEIVVNPDVLVIVLKRYNANPDGSFSKNQAPIMFPLEGLRFGKYKYACYGIVQHSGTLGHGHYFASVLLDDKKKHWVCFNDQQVTRYNAKINETFGIQISAAGFFYVRQCTN